MAGLTGVWVSGLVLVGLATPLAGQGESAREQNQVLQELFRNEVVYPQQRGEYQLSVQASAGTLGTTLPLRLEYGLTSSLQVELGFGRAPWRENGELGFGIKKSFMNLRGSANHLAAGYEMEFERSGGRQHTPFVVLARDLKFLSGAHLFGSLQARFDAGSHAGEAEPSQEHSRDKFGWGGGSVFRLGRRARVSNEINIGRAEDIPGYSTIDYLRQFPFDTLKLERRFIQRLDSGQDREMVEGLIKLAARLNLDVVAEGIETSSQLKTLQALGCKWGQGYLFSRPISPADAEKLLASDQRLCPANLEQPADELLCA